MVTKVFDRVLAKNDRPPDGPGLSALSGIGCRCMS